MEGDNMDNYLGLDIQDDNTEDFANTDLFKAFHESKKNNQEAIINSPGEEPDTANEDNALGNPPVVSATDTILGKQQDPNKPIKQAAKPPKEEIDENAILNLIKESKGIKPDTPLSENPPTEPIQPGDSKSPSQFTTMYEHFTSEYGLPTLPEGEVFDGSEEKFIDWMMEVRQDNVNETANNFISEAFASQKQNEPLAKEFFAFISSGGSVNTFLETHKHDDITPEYLTTEDEDVKESRAERILREMHLGMGWDVESVDKYVNNLKKSGTLEAIAETALPQFIKTREARKAVELQKAASDKLTRDNEIRQHNNSVFKLIDESKEFLSFPLATPKEKQKIKEYMYVPTVDMGNGVRIPQYRADKLAAAKNPNYTLYDALNLMNKGVDIENIQNKLENKVKKSLRDKLEANANGRKIDSVNTTAPGNSGKDLSQTVDFDNLQFVN